MYRDHRYRKSKTGRTWEPEYLRFPGSRDRVIIHRLRFNLFAIPYSCIQIFHITEKPRKPYGSGVSYVWTQRTLRYSIYFI